MKETLMPPVRTAMLRVSYYIEKYIRILIQIWLRFIHKGIINDVSNLVEIMAWRQTCNKSVSQLMLA